MPTIYNKIALKGNPSAGRYDEGRAATIITPGHVIKRDAAGTLSVHNVQGGVCQNMFAIEDSLQGKKVTDNYAIGDLVRFRIFKSGDVVYAVIKDGVDLQEGTAMQSEGDGTLSAQTSTNHIVGHLAEDCDLTGSNTPTTGTHCAVQIR